VHWLTQETNQAGRQLYDRIATRSGFIQYRHLLGDRP
ncbi:MAG TPA: GNAT family N-acetyltransferase, partial [Pseudomonas sp.]|nr:GNAT family N-acetyltransferase [Pseudomonas sp.]